MKLFKNSHVDVTKVVIIAGLTLALVFALYYAYKISIDPAFTKKVEKFGSDTEVILLFSPSCPYCIKFHPTFDAVAAKMSGKASFKALSNNIPPKLMEHVEGYPTTVVLKNGAFVDKIVGNVSEHVFTEFVKRFV